MHWAMVHYHDRVVVKEMNDQESLFVFLFIEVSINAVQNEQIEADVEQLMDLMKTRKQQLESLLEEKMKDFRLVCELENVSFSIILISRSVFPLSASYWYSYG